MIRSTSRRFSRRHRPLWAHHASNKVNWHSPALDEVDSDSPVSDEVDSDSPAWKLLQTRLGLDIKVENEASENPPDITFVPAVTFVPADTFEPPDPFVPADTFVPDDTFVPALPQRDLVLLTPTPPRRAAVTIVGSLVVHSLAAVVIWFALAYKPPSSRVITESAIVRELELRAMAEEMAQVNRRIPVPKLHHDAAASAPKAQPAPPKIQAKQGPQTLLQPDVPKPVALPQPIPVPQVMIWAASKVVVKRVTPPLLKKPVSADVVPNLDRPNQELKLADVNISSGFKPSPKSLTTPSTTSPIALRNSVQVQQVPSSVSQIAGAPAPAAILSLSDLHLKDGTAALPPVNEAQKSNSQGGLGSGQDKTPLRRTATTAPTARLKLPRPIPGPESLPVHPGNSHPLPSHCPKTAISAP